MLYEVVYEPFDLFVALTADGLGCLQSHWNRQIHCEDASVAHFSKDVILNVLNQSRLLHLLNPLLKRKSH